jgi:hypothetical protein
MGRHYTMTLSDIKLTAMVIENLRRVFTQPVAKDLIQPLSRKPNVELNCISPRTPSIGIEHRNSRGRIGTIGRNHRIRPVYGVYGFFTPHEPCLHACIFVDERMCLIERDEGCIA